MSSSPLKRFYTIHNARLLYEIIDLETITYIKLITGLPTNHKVKISYKFILSSGAELTGHEYRKVEGGKPVWAERLATAWQKYHKHQGVL